MQKAQGLDHPEQAPRRGCKSMIKLAEHSINSFACEQNDAVPPSEQVFVLSGSQLQEIIESAIDKATAPLKAEIEELWQGNFDDPFPRSYNRLFFWNFDSLFFRNSERCFCCHLSNANKGMFIGFEERPARMKQLYATLVFWPPIEI